VSLAAPAARAEAPPRPRDWGRFSIASGLDFSSGDYSDRKKTEIWYAPLSLKYERGPWIARLTVPYLRIRGPGNVVFGPGGAVVLGTGARKRETNEGLGDVIAGVGYVLDPWRPALPFLELSGKIKFPTASSSRGLGTGEFDYSLQLDAWKRFGAFTPFGNFGYRFVGDPPHSSLRNTLFGSLGVDWRPRPYLGLGLAYDWRQSASRHTGDAQDLSPYLSWKVFRHVSLEPYGVIGFSRAAPDYGVGFQIRYRP
jgi:hypothetical protein